MRAKTLLSPIFAVLLLSAGSLSAAGTRPGATASDSGNILDQKQIHQYYDEGDFERVIAGLEAFMARNPSYSLEDSIFIAKHLAVVYSANPQTREKGNYFMYRLLDMLPAAMLVDMYVGAEIDRIFQRVRDEFITRQMAFGVDSTEINLPRNAPSTRPRAASAPAASAPATGGQTRINPVYFIAGGSAVLAAVAVSYFIFSDSPQPTEKVYDVR